MRLVAVLFASVVVAAAGCRDLGLERRVAAAAGRFAREQGFLPPRYSEPSCVVVVPAFLRYWQSCVTVNLETGVKVSFVCSDESCAYEGET